MQLHLAATRFHSVVLRRVWWRAQNWAQCAIGTGEPSRSPGPQAHAGRRRADWTVPHRLRPTPLPTLDLSAIVFRQTEKRIKEAVLPSRKILPNFARQVRPNGLRKY